MVSVGNDTNPDTDKVRRPGNDNRLVREAYPIDALYMVDKLEVTKAPELKSKQSSDGEFYSDYLIVKHPTPKDEWFNEYLQDMEITVHYVGTNETKTMVANPKGDKELPLYDHFANTRSLLSVQPNGRGETFDAPKFNGPTNGIRNAWNMLVFSHENSQRYGELNTNRSMVRYQTIGPIQVYVLQDELEVESTGGEISYPITPINDRGNVDKLLSQLKITATWVYMDRDGNEDTKTREVDVKDPRLTITSPRSEPEVMIDNVIRRAGTGVYDATWWGRPQEQEIALRYTETLDVGNIRRADGSIDISVGAEQQ